MTAIYKSTLEITDVQLVEMPSGSCPLSVAMQRGMLRLWYFVPDTHAKKIQRRVVIVGTGNPADHVSLAAFVGTVLTHDDALVWHVFVE